MTKGNSEWSLPRWKSQHCGAERRNRGSAEKKSKDLQKDDRMNNPTVGQLSGTVHSYGVNGLEYYVSNEQKA